MLSNFKENYIANQSTSLIAAPLIQIHLRLVQSLSCSVLLYNM